MTARPNVMIIGLDGGTMDLMNPWMKQGKLPTFQQIQKNGVSGLLNSTIPPYSAPAWVSICTGCQPGKHGIYDFFRTDNPQKNLVNSRMRKTPALWNYLTDMDKHSIVVGVPGTYPPEKINGVMITGLLTPSPESSYTHPRHIKEQLIDGQIGHYELEQVGVDDIPKNLYARYQPQRLVDKINRMTASHATVTLNLMKQHPWDFAMMVFRGTDDAQHLLWQKKEYILSCYQQADTYLKTIMDTYPNTLFIIVSDHGFGTPQKYLYVNNVLYNHQLLAAKTNPQYAMDNLTLTVFDKISWLVFRLFPMEKLVRTKIGRKMILSKGSSANIDFTLSKAMYHSVCSRGIRILLKDKYKDGNVPQKDYKHLRSTLIDIFKNLTDPETDQPIIQNIYTSEEIYGTNAVNDPLDLILEPSEGFGTQELLRNLPAPQPQQGKLPILTPPGFYDWMGDHQQYGILFMHGPNIQSGMQIKASVYDIVPTILAYLKLPIPNLLDGTVIQDAFLKKLPVKKVSWPPKKTHQKLTTKEQNVIRRLKEKF